MRKKKHKKMKYPACRQAGEKYSDEHWMALALKEAGKALGKTSPNPMVGAVLVRAKKLLAKGHHRRAGLPHAEAEVLKKVSNPKGATLYVTLEPCCHTKKRTPPCVEAILNAKIKKVVVGCLDPNPQVAGRGVRLLRLSGVQVQVGVLKKECEELNRYYRHWIQKKIPWVVLKMASSMDGRIALANGRSQWITGEAARERGHQLRAEVDAILVGIGTVLADNPRLTARISGKPKQPARIVLDPQLKISERAKVIGKKGERGCWVITQEKFLGTRQAKHLMAKGVEILACPLNRQGKFDLKKLLKLLGKQGIVSLMVEGGSGVWTEFLKQKCVQEIFHFIAPKFLGGDAQALFAPLGYEQLPKQNPFTLQAIERLGEDVLLRYQRI